MWYEDGNSFLLDERPMELCTGKERLKKFVREILPEILDAKRNIELEDVQSL